MDIAVIDDFFSQEELELFLQNDLVKQYRSQLNDTVKKIRFSLHLTDSVLQKLQLLDVTCNGTVPMMWISEDSLPHVDQGPTEFHHTVLVYLSPSTEGGGSLIINNTSYEIKQGRAFRFPRGLLHHTENTSDSQSSPRLLIGPINEFGDPVGGASINYFPSYSDVYPDPNFTNIVYSDYNTYPVGGTIATSNTFPDSSTIPPPFPGATVHYWAGQKGYYGNYVDVSYNPGESWPNEGFSVFLYPVWNSQNKVMCFNQGTKILCLDPDSSESEPVEKYIPIETLKPGVLVKTVSSGYKPIVFLGHTKIYNPYHHLRSKNRLYICHPQMYPELQEDLILTGCHSILVPNMTDKEKADTTELLGELFVTDNHYRLMACIDQRARPYIVDGLYTVWHFALQNIHPRANYGIYANGLLVESSSIRMMNEYSGMELV